MVITYARKHNKTFQGALSILLSDRSLNKQSSLVQHLNFHSASVRGDDLKFSVLDLGKYTKNAYEFTQLLKEEANAKSDRDLIKKIALYEFRDSLTLLATIGSQLNRLENRYLLNGITFKEAYARKCDQFNLLLSMICDLRKFGFTSTVKQYFYEFCSEIVDPKFDLNSLDESKAMTIPREVDECIENESSSEDCIDSAFSFDGNNFIYNVSKEFGCSISVKTPLDDLYNNKRKNFSNTNEDTIYEKYKKDRIKPRFTSNGKCWEFNFYVPGSPHANKCLITTKEHLKTHGCADCDGPHGCLCCPFVRCKAFLSCLPSPNSWFTINFDLSVKYPAKPNNKYNNNKHNSIGYYNNNSSNNNQFREKRNQYGYNNNNNNNSKYQQQQQYQQQGGNGRRNDYHNDNNQFDNRRGFRGGNRRNDRNDRDRQGQQGYDHSR